MKNSEFYKDEIIKILARNSKIIDGEFMESNHNVYRDVKKESDLAEWLKAEYNPLEHDPIIDWSKVEVDTPVIVSYNRQEWFKEHFAKYEDGKVYTFYWGATSWSNKNDNLSVWNYARLGK